MRTSFTCLLAIFFLATQSVFSQNTRDVVVPLTPAIDLSTPSVTLTWESPSPSDFILFKRDKDSADWFIILDGAASTVTSYTDTQVSVGQTYEYGIQRLINNIYAFGYVTVPLEAPVVDSRGAISVFVEESLETPLAVELERYRSDLIGDGWHVIWHSVAAAATVATVKNQIVNDYDAQGISTVFLFGEIPVPYSGNVYWDGHPDHQGAWPSDTYYGDITSIAWTDATVNTATNGTQPSRSENVNIPGDGKFDQDLVPTYSELAVGRVDFSNLSEATFGTTRIELYRRYLNKNHNWRSKQYTVGNRALVDDNFGYFGGEAFAANGYRNANPLVGPSNVFDGDFFNDTDGEGYLFGYGTGGGTYTSAGGVGTSAQFGSDSVNIVFAQLFGSYHGDWDYSPDPFMMSAIASKGGILTCSWAGRPHWFSHHLGAGETMGYCALQTQNACDIVGYFETLGRCGAHVTLLGDPTVRAQIVAPVSNVVVSQLCNETSVSWVASPQPNVDGYYVYRSNTVDGNYERLSPDLITGLDFTDEFPESGTTYYMVKAVVREVTPSGIFFNSSTGVSTSLNYVPSTPPSINLPASVSLTCTNPTYTLNSCGPGYDCFLEGPGGPISLPATISQAGSYTVLISDQATGCTATKSFMAILNNTIPVGPTVQLGTIDCQAQTVQLFGISNPTGIGYTWEGPNGFTTTQQNPVVSASGDYTLVVTNISSGCTSYATVTVPVISVPNATATGGSITCGSPSVQLMATSTSSNITYAWSGPNQFSSNAQNPTVSTAGDYILLVTDQNGCTSTATAVVTQSGDLPVAEPAPSGILTCIVTEVTILANPAQIGYDYAWTGPNGFSSVEQDPVVTEAGVYFVEVTNSATGCSTIYSTTVSGFQVPDISGSLPDLALNCTILSVPVDVSSICGMPGFFCGLNGQLITGPLVISQPGNYELVVTHIQSGCTASDEFVVSANTDAPNLSIQGDPNIDCAGGTATLTASSSTTGVSFNWTGLGNNPTQTVAAGTYTVTATGPNGCTAVQTIVVTPPPPFSISIQGDTNIDCAGGTVTLTASSSTPGVSFNWAGLGNNPTQTVAVGTYTVTATSPSGCTTVQSITATEPLPLSISVSGIADCEGFFDASVTVTGGTAPYNIDFSPALPIPPSTNYEIEVTDAHGCTESFTDTTDGIVPPEFSVIGTDETVLGENDGTATAVFNSGVPPFTYLWSNGQTTQSISNLSPGTYTCTITDNNGCEVVGSVVIDPGVNATHDLPGLRSISLSPNPTTGWFGLSIAFENPLSVQVELLDVAGRVLSATNIESVLEKSWSFDLSSSPSGVYFCKITANGHLAMLKLVKLD